MPYILDRNPSGSSSGSGSATAANLCAVAIGTETDGSVVSPSSVNGLVGIKPTVGLLSRTGIIPISFTQDTAGPLARTVKDAAVLLGLLTGIDTTDDKSKESEGKFLTDYTKFLDAGSLKGKRIGIEKKKYENQLLNTILEKAVALMKQQGASIVELEYLDKLNTPTPRPARVSKAVALINRLDGLRDELANLAWQDWTDTEKKHLGNALRDLQLGLNDLQRAMEPGPE